MRDILPPSFIPSIFPFTWFMPSTSTGISFHLTNTFKYSVLPTSDPQQQEAYHLEDMSLAALDTDHHSDSRKSIDKSSPTYEVRHEPARPSLESDTFTAKDILRGTAGHSRPATSFEKKAALINLELDKLGFGRYQWCLWFLCGFGYLVDLLWAQGFGLISTPIYQEMDVPAGRQGLIFTAQSVGLTVGALFWGVSVDIIGRRWAFNLTLLITCVFGMLTAAPINNYNAICALSALMGFGLGGQIPIDATIVLEFLPQNKRFLLALLSMWQPVGVVLASVIAFGLVPKYRCDTSLDACSTVAEGAACCTVRSNIGWRYFLITIGCITLGIFFVRFFLFTFYESPKFLLGRGKEQEAIEVLHKIAAFNKRPPPNLTMEDFALIDQEYAGDSSPAPAAPLNTKQHTKKTLREAVQRLGHLRGLFQTKVATLTFVILLVAYLGDFWSFNLAGSFLPIILNNRNIDSGTQTVTDTYRQYVYIYLPGVLGAVMAMGLINLPVLGRKWSLVITAILQGLSMAMYTQVYTTAGYVGLNAFEYICQTAFNAVLYATTPELFPAFVRGTACGTLSMFGRLSGIVAPFAGQHFLATDSQGILWLAAGGIWVSALVLVFIPVEMKNRQAY